MVNFVPVLQFLPPCDIFASKLGKNQRMLLPVSSPWWNGYKRKHNIKFTSLQLRVYFKPHRNANMSSHFSVSLIISLIMKLFYRNKRIPFCTIKKKKKKNQWPVLKSENEDRGPQKFLVRKKRGCSQGKTC